LSGPRTPREVDLQEEARRTFAAPPEPGGARRHSVDVPLQDASSFLPQTESVATSSMPTGVPLPSEKDRSVGAHALVSNDFRKSLPSTLLPSRSIIPPSSSLSFKPLIERRTTGSQVLAASGASYSIDSPAPPRSSERMSAPLSTFAASPPSGSIMLPPTSFTPARRANGPEVVAAVSDADNARTRRYSVPATSLPVLAPSLPQPTVATVAPHPPPISVVPSQSTPVLRSSSPAAAKIEEAPPQKHSPRLRLIPSPHASPPTNAPHLHGAKSDKQAWKQKLKAVNAQIFHELTTKREAYDGTADERAVTVQRCVEQQQHLTPIKHLRSSSSPSPSASPAAPTHIAVVPPAPGHVTSVSQDVASAAVFAPQSLMQRYSGTALLWLWFLLSYSLLGLQLLSVALKETCEALATVFELASLGLSRLAADVHNRSTLTTARLAPSHLHSD